jgi:hypothetical protein
MCYRPGSVSLSVFVEELSLFEPYSGTEVGLRPRQKGMNNEPTLLFWLTFSMEERGALAWTRIQPSDTLHGAVLGTRAFFDWQVRRF